MSAAWALLRRQGVKKAPSSRVRSIWDEPSKTKAFTYTAHCVWNTPRYHFVCCTGSHSQRTYIRSPVTWAKRPCITGRRGQRLCSHRLLAGENALLLTTALASDGRLSGRGCCKESCPVHRICRMIVRILVRNSQIVNIFGTSSEDALIQKSVPQKFLGDFCSCVKRRKLYTSTNEKSSRQGLDFHTLMC